MIFDQPTVVFDRVDLEMSGASSYGDFYQLLSFHNFLAPPVTVFMNGRVHSVYDNYVDYLPAGMIERVEVYLGGVSRKFNAETNGTVINIVLKKGGEKNEARIGFEIPESKGGRAKNASAVWGSKTDDGYVTLAAGYFKRGEIAYADRDYTESKWKAGGNFDDGQSISPGGNTFLANSGINPIGDCDPEIYTGELQYSTGKACGFPYGNYAWLTDRIDQTTVLVENTKALDDSTTLFVYANLYGSNSKNIAAPAVDLFPVTLPAAVSPSGTQESGLLYHRFVANGNRVNSADLEGYNVAVEVDGQFARDLEWAAKLILLRVAYFTKGAGYINKSAAQSAIQNETYDVANPLSTPASVIEGLEAPLTRDAIEEVQGLTFSVSGRAAPRFGDSLNWQAGMEYSNHEYTDLYDKHRQNDNVIGSSLAQTFGERKNKSMFATATWALDEKWEFDLAGRYNDHSDSVETNSLQLTSRMLVRNGLTFRAAIGDFSSPPAFTQLDLQSKSHPYLVDTKRCKEGVAGACRLAQYEVNYVGNPDLEATESDRLDLGLSGQFSNISFSADWTRTRSTNQPVASPQYILDQESKNNLPDHSEVNRVGGTITNIVVPYVNNAETDTDAFHWHVKTERNLNDKTVLFSLAGAHFLDREYRVNDIAQNLSYPNNRYRATLGATKGNFSANWSIKVVSGFDNLEGTARYEPWKGHDVTFQWRQALNNEQLTIDAGILNVTDKDPSTDPTSAAASGITGWHPWYGREIYIGATYFF